MSWFLSETDFHVIEKGWNCVLEPSQKQGLNYVFWSDGWKLVQMALCTDHQRKNFQYWNLIWQLWDLNIFTFKWLSFGRLGQNIHSENQYLWKGVLPITDSNLAAVEENFIPLASPGGETVYKHGGGWSKNAILMVTQIRTLLVDINGISSEFFGSIHCSPLMLGDQENCSGS